MPDQGYMFLVIDHSPTIQSTAAMLEANERCIVGRATLIPLKLNEAVKQPRPMTSSSQAQGRSRISHRVVQP